MSFSMFKGLPESVFYEGCECGGKCGTAKSASNDETLGNISGGDEIPIPTGGIPWGRFETVPTGYYMNCHYNYDLPQICTRVDTDGRWDRNRSWKCEPQTDQCYIIRNQFQMVAEPQV